MAENTAISWATHTFSPWVGCTKVSDACTNCYAEAWAKRAGHPELWQGTRRRTRPENWKGPLKWNKQAERDGVRPRIFCSSLADIFDNQADPAWRHDLFRLIQQTQHCDWLILTKRVGNANAMIAEAIKGLKQQDEWPWCNVWLGATIANQEEADRDIPKLLATPARVRFLSCEPLLGPINLNFVRMPGAGLVSAVHGELHNGLAPDGFVPSVDWVIAGGESGGKARPSHPDWFRSLRDQCAAAGVAFFMKQMGGKRDKRDALESIPEDLRLRAWPQ